MRALVGGQELRTDSLFVEAFSFTNVSKMTDRDIKYTLHVQEAKLCQVQRAGLRRHLKMYTPFSLKHRWWAGVQEHPLDVAQRERRATPA